MRSYAVLSKFVDELSSPPVLSQPLSFKPEDIPSPLLETLEVRTSSKLTPSFKGSKPRTSRTLLITSGVRGKNPTAPILCKYLDGFF